MSPEQARLASKRQYVVDRTVDKSDPQPMEKQHPMVNDDSGSNDMEMTMVKRSVNCA